MRTGDDGHVDRVRIGWRARCENGGTYKSRTLFAAPLDESSATAFEDTGNYTARPSGYVARIKVSIAGSWGAARDRWRGTFNARVRVVKQGKVVDTCRVKRLRWWAGPA